MHHEIDNQINEIKNFETTSADNSSIKNANIDNPIYHQKKKIIKLFRKKIYLLIL